MGNPGPVFFSHRDPLGQRRLHRTSGLCYAEAPTLRTESLELMLMQDKTNFLSLRKELLETRSNRTL